MSWIRILKRPLSNRLTAVIFLKQDNEELSKPFKVRILDKSGRRLYELTNSRGHQDTFVTGLLRKPLDFDEVALLLNEAESWREDDPRCVFLEEDKQ